MKKLLTAILTLGLLTTGALVAPANAASATSASLKAEYSKRLDTMTYAPFTKQTSSVDKASEKKVFSTLNSDRFRAGKKSITRSTKLDAVARAYAKKMATTKDFKHNPNLRYEAPAGWQALGENIAWNDAKSDSTGMALYYQWMKSDGHRNNILSTSWTHVGVGIYIDKNGRHWGVQVFGKYKNSPDKASATISGFSKGLKVKPKSTVSWKNVKLSHAGKLQKYSGGKWVTVKNLKKGTQTVKIKASSKYGKTVKYRIIIKSTSKLQGTKTSTVKLSTKSKG